MFICFVVYTEWLHQVTFFFRTSRKPMNSITTTWYCRISRLTTSAPTPLRRILPAQSTARTSRRLVRTHCTAPQTISMTCCRTSVTWRLMTGWRYLAVWMRSFRVATFLAEKLCNLDKWVGVQRRPEKNRAESTTVGESRWRRVTEFILSGKFVFSQCDYCYLLGGKLRLVMVIHMIVWSFVMFPGSWNIAWYSWGIVLHGKCQPCRFYV